MCAVKKVIICVVNKAIEVQLGHIDLRGDISHFMDTILRSTTSQFYDPKKEIALVSKYCVTYELKFPHVSTAKWSITSAYYYNTCLKNISST